MIVDLTIPRSEVLTLNQRMHWRAKATRTATLRAKAAALTHGITYRGQVHVLAELAFPDRRRRDAHNWMPTLKALIDGLVQGGLIPDDDTTHLIGPDVRISDDRADVGTIRVHLTITETHLEES